MCILQLMILQLTAGVVFTPFVGHSNKFPDFTPQWISIYSESELPSSTFTSTTKEPLPYFYDGDLINVTAQLGSDVFLHCRVEELGEKTISWLRKHNTSLDLLSVGKLTYSADSRYNLMFSDPTDWKLRIQYVGKRDIGWYECQVSSHPPIVRRIYLNVIVPKVSIVDERNSEITEKLYKEGSIISLRCIVSRVPDISARQITWKHGGRLLNYDTRRGGVSVKTEWSVDASGLLSRLYIANASKRDSGNYTCALQSDIASSYVTVHVLTGENPQAMQRGTSNTLQSVNKFLLAILLIGS